MTTFEMQQLFETLLQTSSVLYNDSEKPDTDVIFRYLNEAQIKYIRDKYLSAPTFYERTRVVGNALNDLKELVYIETLTNSVSNYYQYSITLTSSKDVWHYISISCRASRNYPQFFEDVNLDFLPIEAEEINKYLTTPINKPIIYVPVYTQVYNTSSSKLDVLIIHDSYSIITSDVAQAHVIVKPKTLVLDILDANTETTTCQLASYLHEDIVKLAVALFEEQKYKLAGKSKEDNK